MNGVGDDFTRAMFDQSFRSLAQRACGIDHVIDNDTGAVPNITNDVHDLSLVGLGTAFVDDRQIGPQLFGNGPCAHHTTNVGRDHDQVFKALTLNVVEQNRRAVDVVDRNAEEP